MRKLLLLTLALCMLLCACQAVPNDSQNESDGAEVQNAATLGSSAQVSGAPAAEQSAEPTAELDDEGKIKLTIENYFACRHELVSSITDDAFDTQSDAALRLAACCAGDEFVNEVLVTAQMSYEQKQLTKQYCGTDLSYASYSCNVEYDELDISDNEASANVTDCAVVYFAQDSEVESNSSDAHTLKLEKQGDEWKIVSDESPEKSPAAYYSQRYNAYLEEYAASYDNADVASRNEYILEAFRAAVISGLEAGGFSA